MPDHHIQTKQLLENIEQLIEAKDFEQLKELLSISRTSEVAEVVEVLDEIARQILFDLLDPRDAGEVLEKIDEATRSEVVEDMTGKELGEMLSSLPPDEAADVMAEFSDEQTEQALEHFDEEDSELIEKLLSYEEDTAGGIMTPEVVKVNINQTIRDAIRAYREADHDEHFFNVYVVDRKNKLLGAIDIHTLLKYPRKTSINEILDAEVPVIHLRDDQEVIANTFRKNDLISAPVVDDNGILVGRITVDDIVDVMDEEAEEDVLKMAGTHPDELDTHKSLKIAMVRLPWLLVCMSGSMLSAIVLYKYFANKYASLSNPEIWTHIVTFVPAVTAMGGNSGMQTSTVVVRGLATGDLVALDLIQVLQRELKASLIVAIICALVSGSVALAGLSIFEDVGIRDISTIALSVGLAMFCAVSLSTLMGLFLPYLFRKVGIDPAISSGPLITTSNDILSFMVYFALGLWLLSIFG